MQLAFEVPTPTLPKLGQYNDYEFCLAHLATTSEKYRRFFKASNKFTVCDNSAFELGRPVEHEEILDAAKAVGAQEVVSPDSFRNGSKTIDATENFITYLHKKNRMKDYQVMGVIQGTNAPDWAFCLKYMQEHPDIKTIGICYVSCHIFDKDPCNARLQATSYIHNMCGTKGKKIHLLGMGGNPLELKLHTNPYIRSCDTSLPIVQGLSGDRLDEKEGLKGAKLPRPHNFFDADVADDQLEHIVYNISTMKNWAGSLSNA